MQHYSKTLLIFIVFFTAFAASAQERITEKNLLGNWKMVIDVEEAFEEAKLEVEENESAFASIILNSVSGLVTGILDEVDIFMEFLPKGELKIVVEAFDEQEIEYTNWSIKGNKLYIEDSPSLSSDDEYWILQDGVLFSESLDEPESEKKVYMVNID